MDLIKKFREFVKENSLLSVDDTVVLGLSGGADSMCLLFLLKELGIKLLAVHIHHGIRGAEADGDAAFVEDICKKWGIALCVERYDIPSICKKSGESEEECGRRIRYEVFAREAEKLHRAKIAVAHHKNDQAETVLFNLFRGTGIKGLCGMKPQEGNIIRPLLAFDRNEIEKIAKEYAVPFVTDSTNFCQEYSRNCIRGSIIPRAEEINNQAIAHIYDTAKRLQEIEDYLVLQARAAYEKYVRQGIIGGNLFTNEPPVIYKEVLRLALKEAAGRLKDITSEHIQALCRLGTMQTGRRLVLPYGITALKDYGGIRLMKDVKEDQKEDKKEDKNTEFPDFYMRKIDAETVCLTNIPNKDYTKWFDCDKIKGNPVLRYRQKGDTIAIKTPKGTGHQSIQDFFTRQKIAAIERDKIPLLADGEDIIWVVGYRISEEYKVTESTKHILEVSIEKRD